MIKAGSKAPLKLRRLGPGEAPELGLFFLQAERAIPSIQAGERRPATGMAFLVHESGILATCAHVILAIPSLPGRRVRLFGVRPNLPIDVEAEVVHEGWLGPPYQLGNAAVPASGTAETYAKRPDLFRQDLAFLRILPETLTLRPPYHRPTTSAHPAAGATQIDALALLEQKARVLPLGVPGYKVGGAELRAWWTLWINNSPATNAATAHFRGVERALFDVVRLESSEIQPGFSGSPLWDDDRRLAVGMVRRGLNPTLPDVVLGTDARAFLHHPDVKLSHDAGLDGMLALVRLMADRLAPSRHEDLLDWDDPAIFVEPSVVPAIPRDDLTANAPPPARPAMGAILGAIREHALTQVFGIAGTGKSTLLGRVAHALLDDPIPGDKRLIPLPVTAGELAAADADLTRLLSTARSHFGGDAEPAETLRQALVENDARVVLLVDGLDEIPRAQQTKLLLRLRAGADRDGLIYRTVVMSRPLALATIDQYGMTRSGFMALAIEPFDPEKTGALAARFFPATADAELFLAELRQVRWDRSGPTPLQLRIAASVFRRARQLPRRALELTEALLEHTLERAKSASPDLSRRDPKAYTEHFIPNLDQILFALGYVTIVHGEPTLEQAMQYLETLSRDAGAPSWLCDFGTLQKFIEEDLPRRTGLIWCIGGLHRGDPADPKLMWMHRTFAEACAARWEISNIGVDTERLKSAFRAAEGAYAFALLAEMERVGQNGVVAEILNDLIRAPTSSLGPTLTALRALAAGIDAGGRMRGALIRLLVRVLLSEQANSILCAEVFSPSEQLPSPLDIAKRPELRVDVRTALAERWRMRFARIQAEGSRRAVRVSVREALLLDQLHMWSEFGLPLADPRSATGESMSLTSTDMFAGLPPAAKVGHLLPGATTTILLRGPDGEVTPMTVDSREFVDNLVEFGRRQPHRSGTELVALFVEMVLQRHQTSPIISRGSPGRAAGRP